MATQVPSLNIVAGKGGAVDRVVDIPSGFDQILGRDTSADIMLADPAISRRHARLYRGADGVWLEDLGSTNGTYINGDRLTVPYRLRDGDEVKLGNSLATFHEVANGPDATQIIAALDAAPATAAPEAAAVGLQAAPVATAADTLGLADGAGAGAPAGLPAGPSAAPVDPGVRQAAPVETPDPRPQATPDPAPVAQAAAPPAPAPAPASTSGACPDCSTPNRSEAWFCSQCGRQLRAVPSVAGEQVPARAESRPAGPMTMHGEIRRQEFRQAMRARNGGRRVPYNESLALPTIVFRAFLALLLLALAVFGLVILNEGIHRVFGL